MAANITTDGATKSPAVKMYGLLNQLLETCPDRPSASPGELRAQQMIGRELADRGADVTFYPFRFNSSLYAVLALHFGIAGLAAPLVLVAPLSAMLIHLVLGISYLGDSTRRFFLLRRCFPFRRSQNLVARMPARGALRRRIVLLAHADASATGWMFRPGLVRAGREESYWRPFRFVRKQLQMATAGMFIMATLEGYAAWSGNLPWLLELYVLGIGLHCLSIAALNLQPAVSRRVVPGANDNLSGCVALVQLADELRSSKPDDIELVLVVTGCEEAGTGGSHALVRTMGSSWDREHTVIIALDSLGGGALKLCQDGEVLPLPVPQWLVAKAFTTASCGGERLGIHRPAAGSTDAVPFAARGYDAIALISVDEELGAPAHWHRMTDTLENLDIEQLVRSVRFAAALVRSLGNRPMVD